MNRSVKLLREDGFTLLELMMVIGIIGILVSIAVLSFAMSISTSKTAVCKGNLRIIREQIMVYYSEHEGVPPTLEDLVPDYISKDDSLHCPETDEGYDYDAESGEVTCPYHTDS